jgi:hypothetical protein
MFKAQLEVRDENNFRKLNLKYEPDNQLPNSDNVGALFMVRSTNSIPTNEIVLTKDEAFELYHFLMHYLTR